MLAFWGCPSGVRVQAQAGRPDARREVRRVVAAPRLELQEVEKVYCGGEQLRLRVKLRFANIGERPLILYKFAGGIFQEMYSTSAEAAAAGRYKMVADNMLVRVKDFEIPVEPSPGSLYVVLQSGETHEVTERVIIFVGLERKLKSYQLKPGDYFLQVKVSTWDGSSALANQLRENWKGIGNFWTGDVTSLPMHLTVDSQHSASPCPK